MAVAVPPNVATVWRSGSMSVTSIPQNYNPYEGDEPLLAAATQRTRTLWKHALFNKEGHVQRKYRICSFLVIVVTLGCSHGSVAQTKELPKIVILVSNVSKLPRVDILYACADMSADLIDASAAHGAKGIVIAGVGNGNMNEVSLRAESICPARDLPTGFLFG
jgi:hypothetical protein